MPNQKLVPWLAAYGPLAYTPEKPPPDDSFFEYRRFMPEVFWQDGKFSAFLGAGPGYAGFSDSKQVVGWLELFWNHARRRITDRVAFVYGQKTKTTFVAPIAIYRVGKRNPYYVLMQCGSYQIAQRCTQPFIEDGYFVVYRGIRNAETYHHFSFPAGSRRRVSSLWENFIEYNYFSFVDSRWALQTALSFINKPSTAHVRDAYELPSRLQTKEFKSAAMSEMFYSLVKNSRRQHFSLSRNIGEHKFGPNFVAIKTPISNVRVTPFFTFESEVSLIDPSLIEFLPESNCKIMVEAPFK